MFAALLLLYFPRKGFEVSFQEIKQTSRILMYRTLSAQTFEWYLMRFYYT